MPYHSDDLLAPSWTTIEVPAPCFLFFTFRFNGTHIVIVDDLLENSRYWVHSETPLGADTSETSTMLTSRLLLRPGLVSCSRNTGHTLRLRQSPSSILLDSSRRVFASTPRHRKDDAQARTVQGEPEKSKVDAKTAKDAVSPTGPASATAKGGPLLAEQTVSNKEQRKADWAIIKDMAHYLWPKNDFSTRFRVGLSVGLLVGAKVRGSLVGRSARRTHVDSLHVGPQCPDSVLFQDYRRFHEH
jgi:hypothetical protein